MKKIGTIFNIKSCPIGYTGERKKEYVRKGGNDVARSEAQKAAQARYEAKGAVKAKTKGYYLKCHVEHDADIINKMESIGTGNKNTYIKELIRKDIQKQG